MMARAVVVHQIPGRARFVVREKRGDADYFSRLSEEVSRFDNVHRAKVNPATGSVTLEFSGGLQDIAQHAQMRQLFTVEQDDLVDRPLSSGAAPRNINLVSGREIGPMFMTGTALTLLGIVQTIRGQIAVPAIASFWYAVEAFRQSGKRP